MASRTVFNAEIAMLTGIPSHTIDRIGVNLNKAGLIRSGGRGLNAAALEPIDLRNIVLALMGSEKTSQAAEVVARLGKLESKTGESFGDALLKICSGGSYLENLETVGFCKNYPMATIKRWGEDEEIFTDPNPPEGTMYTNWAYLQEGAFAVLTNLFNLARNHFKNEKK